MARASVRLDAAQCGKRDGVLPPAVEPRGRTGQSGGNLTGAATPAPVPAPIIVTALFGRGDQGWFDAQRAAYFPAERNQLSAHCTLFHHLPPSSAEELKHRLTQETRGVRAPDARVTGLMSLGRGVAYRIDCPALVQLRGRLVEAFAGLLTPQDAGGWRAHVTIQNKVTPSVAKLLLDQLSRDFRPGPVEIAGLATWWYRGGSWEPLSRHMFA